MRLHRAALPHLRTHDPVLARVIDRVGRFDLTLRDEGSNFAFMARSIIYQQLSGKAAATIHGRFVALFERSVPTADAVLAMSDETLRGAGLSRQKIGYLRDLATHVSQRGLPIETVHTLEDEAIIEALTVVKGIGRWTVQMFLMFRLGRLDVFPENDLGIQKAIRNEYRLRKVRPDRMRRIAEKWKPYRSVACWYLWRSLDNE